MISVIMPAYNAEKHLSLSIPSIIRQTHSDWELIAVDDGSQDNTLKALEQFASEDKRIIALHQENAGPGMARNRGLQEAKGDYIVFVDADDYLDPDYFSLLVPLAEKNDVVFIDVNQVDEQGRILSREMLSAYKDWDLDQITRSQLTGKIPWGGCRKAVSKKLLTENHIYYTNHPIGEEALYSFQLMIHANSVGFLTEKPVYFYVNREGSQSKKRMDDPWGGAVETIREYTKATGIYRKYVSTLNAFEVAALVVSLDRIAQSYCGKEIWKKARERFKSYKEKYDASGGLDKKNLTFKAKVFVPFLAVGIFAPVIVASKMRYLRTKKHTLD